MRKSHPDQPESLEVTPLQVAILKRVLFDTNLKKLAKFLQQHHGAVSDNEVGDATANLLEKVMKLDTRSS